MNAGLINRAGLPVLPALNLSLSAGRSVRSVFTTRAGGVSSGPYASLNLGAHTGDDPAAVAENRRRLRAALPGAPLWLAQVHGAQVLDADTLCPGAVPPTGDAALTCLPARVLTTQVADCLPVLIAATDGSALAVAHAGWRGLAAGVLEASLAALRARRPQADWQAWIGPGIGPQAFEVGPEVRAAFSALGEEARAAFAPHPRQANKWLADLPRLAALRLRRAGLAQITHASLCTVAHPEHFFSYRRDGAATGRMALCAWLE